MNMANIRLGTELEVSKLGFGAMALTDIYGESNREQNLKVVHHALDKGVSFIDTADLYGGGESELLIGNVAQTRRAEMTISTKFGIVTGSEGRLGVQNDEKYAWDALDRSLTRLGVDEIDLYYLHRHDVKMPIEDVVGIMAEMVKSGKVRYLGLSEVTSEEIIAAHNVHQIAAIQTEWSIWSRDVEQTVVPTAARLGIGFVPYSPLGRGFLTGSLRAPDAFASDRRSSMPRFSGNAFRANLYLLDVLSAIAAEQDATLAQIALAWLYSKGEQFHIPVVPIPGTRKSHRIDENADAVHIHLSAQQRQILDGLVSDVQGSRSVTDVPNWTSENR